MTSHMRQVFDYAIKHHPNEIFWPGTIHRELGLPTSTSNKTTAAFGTMLKSKERYPGLERVGFGLYMIRTRQTPIQVTAVGWWEGSSEPWIKADMKGVTCIFCGEIIHKQGFVKKREYTVNGRLRVDYARIHSICLLDSQR